MRNPPALLLFLLFPALTMAQSADGITSRFNEYFGLKERGEYQKFVQYVPEELVKLMPEPQLSASITQTLDNPAFSIQVDSGRINAISPEISFENTAYASVDYSFRMTIRMNEDSFGMFDFILQSLLNQVPEERVEADVTKGTILVRQKSRMVAIRKPSGSWKFLEINDQLADLVGKIVPEEVLAGI